MNKSARIYVAGHRGLVGSAIVRRLYSDGYENLLLRSRSELDLRRQTDVNSFFADEHPEYVFLAAARVGGIAANIERPADFLLDNILIEANVIDAAYRSGAKKLLFLASSCCYPRLAPQPMREESLLDGLPEPTNQAYAIAKLAGLELVSSYRKQYGFSSVSVIPSNIYGPGDRFDPKGSHVLPSLLRRLHEAKVEDASDVVVWGTGEARRELLHVDDLAAACLLVMNQYDGDLPFNVGLGEDITIRELAGLVRDVVGYRGSLRFDASKPDGMPRKLLDVSRLAALGWKATVPLRRGVEETYEWFRKAKV